jgi:hypothetical protein
MNVENINLNLAVTVGQTNVILHALSLLPFNQVSSIIDTITQQGTTQLKEVQESLKAEKAELDSKQLELF